jgi:hypothetical protein
MKSQRQDLAREHLPIEADPFQDPELVSRGALSPFGWVTWRDSSRRGNGQLVPMSSKFVFQRVRLGRFGDPLHPSRRGFARGVADR